MLFLRKPEIERIETLLRQQEKEPFSYPEVGQTRSNFPAGYSVLSDRVLLGKGEAVFEKAKRALAAWKMFDLSWVELFGARPPAVGVTVGVLVKALGLWFLNAAQVVYGFEEEKEGKNLFGFAYGTLPLHEEVGEERFCVEWDRADDRVFYELSSFSRPSRWIFKGAAPLIRGYQKRFARDSLVAFQKALEERSSLLPLV